ncbi:MAG: hypothetical protein SGI77_04650, partial [Pirellulaceae bacterium]|nr:hypothetical protein [Pirellulaceae bacterium]
MGGFRDPQSILAVKYKENTGLIDCKNQGSLSDRKCLPKNCYGLDGAMSLAHRRPRYSSASCFPAEPASASPGTTIMSDQR